MPSNKPAQSKPSCVPRADIPDLLRTMTPTIPKGADVTLLDILLWLNANHEEQKRITQHLLLVEHRLDALRVEVKHEVEQRLGTLETTMMNMISILNAIKTILKENKKE